MAKAPDFGILGSSIYERSSILWLVFINLDQITDTCRLSPLFCSLVLPNPSTSTSTILWWLGKDINRILLWFTSRILRYKMLLEMVNSRVNCLSNKVQRMWSSMKAGCNVSSILRRACICAALSHDLLTDNIYNSVTVRMNSTILIVNNVVKTYLNPSRLVTGLKKLFSIIKYKTFRNYPNKTLLLSFKSGSIF